LQNHNEIRSTYKKLPQKRFTLKEINTTSVLWLCKNKRFCTM